MSLKLILGCMYSGKTTEILRIVNSLKQIGVKPLIIKPKIDDRYSPDKISTHNAQEYDCQTLENLTDFKNPFYEKYIIIEEAQFFKDLFLFVIDQVELRGKNVIVVGLDGMAALKQGKEVLGSVSDFIVSKARCTTIVAR